jgi:hypothetical protein
MLLILDKRTSLQKRTRLSSHPASQAPAENLKYPPSTEHTPETTVSEKGHQKWYEQHSITTLQQFCDKVEIDTRGFGAWDCIESLLAQELIDPRLPGLFGYQSDDEVEDKVEVEDEDEVSEQGSVRHDPADEAEFQKALEEDDNDDEYGKDAFELEPEFEQEGLGGLGDEMELEIDEVEPELGNGLH